ncbi:PucR family transcriptional regulator [Nocardia sp. NPDC127579]|uniref:PucR family transcriptional regulator n=1 Tax=Nocardia sp. NPDC127579 TaxID=3345402 RepID=UPI00362D0408
MTVTSEDRPGLTMSGKPMSQPLQDVRGLARHMVGHFVENVVPCGTLPGEAIRGDVTSITRICLELAVSMLDGRNLPTKIQRLQDAAARWAREGVPIDTIHHAIHEGFKIGVDLVVAANASAGRPGTDDDLLVLTKADYGSLIDGVKLGVEILNRMTTAVSLAYVRELRAVVSEHHTAVHTLTSALLAGHPTSTMARECGIQVAGSYAVLALAIPPHPEESDTRLDGKVVARRKLRRVQAELAIRCGDKALSLLSVDGGTILIPETTPAADLDELIGRLSSAAGVAIVATTLTVAARTIPTAADQAHELLDMAQQMHCPGGLYRFDDLALEFQLTRPGPGREHLGSLLAPLDEHPELLETLRCHIANDLNRRLTARAMHVHTNTVDYRLRRIAQLTGIDPAKSSGLWHLRSALVARTQAAE